jgi:hypothetical protein
LTEQIRRPSEFAFAALAPGRGPGEKMIHSWIVQDEGATGRA